MAQPGRIGRTPVSARGKTSRPKIKQGSGLSFCKWCHEQILWLENSSTRKIAPIDRYPTSGGNIIVDIKAQTYIVIPKKELHLFDTTIAIDEMAKPSLHLNHHYSCTSMHARTLRREHASKGGHDPDLDGPADLVAKATKCPYCPEPMDPFLIEQGLTSHINCGLNLPGQRDN